MQGQMRIQGSGLKRNVCSVIWLAVGSLTLASAALAQQYTITTVAGIGGVRGYFGDSGPAIQGQLDNPTRLTVDSKGNLYFVDYSTFVIRKVDTSGNISTIAGTGSFGYSGDSAAGTSATISQVHGIAVNAGGDVFIADSTNNVIRKIAASNGYITTFAGNGTGGYAGDGAAATKAELNFPISVAVDSSGAVYTTDYYNNCIRKIDSGGNITTIAGSATARGYSGDGGPAAKAVLADPYGLAFDASGNLYFSEIGNRVIRRIDKSGNISTVATNVSTESIAVDAAGAIYYVDYPTSTVRKIMPGGAPTILIAGVPNQPGYSGDSGPGDLAQLNQPNGLALDSSGNVFIADSHNEVIRKLAPNPFSVAAVVSSASNLQAPIAPGEIITLLGAGLGPSTLTTYHVTNGAFDKTVAGTQIYIGGVLAPIVYTSAAQVAVVVPYGISGPTTNITPVYQGQVGSTLQVAVAQASPGIFTLDSTGAGQAAAINQNGTVNTAANPAKIGGYVSFYITGDGLQSPAVADGALVGTALPRTLLSVSATIGGQPAAVSYSGGAPGEVAGLTQVNVQIPAGVAAGSAVPVVISVGGTASQTATIALSN